MMTRFRVALFLIFLVLILSGAANLIGAALRVGG